MNVIDNALQEVISHSQDNFCSEPEHAKKILREYGVRLVADATFEHPETEKMPTRENAVYAKS